MQPSEFNRSDGNTFFDKLIIKKFRINFFVIEYEFFSYGFAIYVNFKHEWKMVTVLAQKEGNLKLFEFCL